MDVGISLLFPQYSYWYVINPVFNVGQLGLLLQNYNVVNDLLNNNLLVINFLFRVFMNGDLKLTK